MDPKKIREALGLAPEATDEEVFAALTVLKSAKEQLAAAKQEADRRVAEKEAEEFAAANEKKCNKEVIKAQYLANKEATIALVNAIAEPKADDPARVTNKAEAKKPSFVADNKAVATDAAILATYENMAGGASKDAFLIANAVAINRARNAK